ncbi:MFS transporter [Pseudomonas fluorescens]|nr:MFS transporter [Pseudomonas fluorescens]
MVQILVWGGSFFLMAVIADPIMKETGWTSQAVYGALSLGILVSAFLAPLTSQLIARWGGRCILASSGLAIAIGLLLMAWTTSLPMFMAAWAIIGVGMALGFFEALFATLGAIYGARASSAITGVTLFSGFATSIVWPLVAFVIEHLGWRATCVVYALLLLISVAPIYYWVLPKQLISPVNSKKNPLAVVAFDRRIYILLTTIFTLAAVIMTAMSVHLLLLLQGQGYSTAAAIGLSTLMGPSQVASRVLQLLSRKRHPIWTTLICVVLVATGLIIVAAYPAAASIALVLYGAGNGLRAIVRGLLPLALMSQAQYVLLMGRMARPTLIAQAITPLAGGYLMHTMSTGFVWGVLCAISIVNVLLVIMLIRSIPD